MKQQVHTHSNRYVYLINEGNKRFDSLDEFMIAQGLVESVDVKFSKSFYTNLRNADGTEYTKKQQADDDHPWHSNDFFEYIWRNPITKKDVTVRRMARFRNNELV